MTEQWDLIVIGAGSGGLAHAQRAAEYGARVMVVESDRLGGTCVNVGCVPKKVMWYAASAAHDRALSESFGFAPAPDAHDWPHLQQARDAYVERLNGIYASNLDNKDIPVVRGRARFIDAQTLDVGGERYSADRFVIATGGHPIVPELPGAELGITSDGFFELETMPRRVALVGSGYVAVEFAGVLAALGAETTLLARTEYVLRSFDPMLRDRALESLQHDGVTVERHVIASRLQRDGDELHLTAEDGRRFGGYDCVIWAVGRAPSTPDLDLDAAGVVTNPEGFIDVDAWQATSVEHIFALGDVTGAVALTPVAIAAGRRLADRLYGGMPERKLDYACIATAIFTHPPIATLGLTEPEARERHGDDVSVYTSTFIPMRYALGDEKRRATMKLVTVGETKRVVGCHIMGDGADEMIQGFAVAIRMGATKADFDDTVAVHPTSAEELVTMR